MIWISDQWKDYEVLDTSDGERLERWGKYILVRPDPQVIWNFIVFPLIRNPNHWLSPFLSYP